MKSSSIEGDGALLAYQRSQRRRLVFLFVAVSLLLLSFIIDISVGPGDFSIVDVFQLLINPNSYGAAAQIIIWDLRLPIAVMAILVGAMLSVSGAQMQTILHNPLADPFTLGILAAASFGAALAIVLGMDQFPGMGELLIILGAFVFSLSTAFLLFMFTRIRGASAETMVLVGIALLFMFNALLSLLQYAATDAQISQIVFWQMGSLARTDWTKVGVCVAVLILITPLLVYRSWALTALRMGDAKASSLGVNVTRLRIEMLLVVSLLTATAASFVGTIAFIGLVGPHIARMLVGEDQRFFMPMSLITGALIMSLTSIVSKGITEGVVYPVGIITSLIGIPFFIGLILGVNKRSWR